MDITSNYHKGADTSILAHASTSEKNRGLIRQMIIDKIHELKKSSCSELERVLNLTHQTCSARLTELLKSGCIINTGLKTYTPRMRLERVYSLAPELFKRIHGS